MRTGWNSSSLFRKEDRRTKPTMTTLPSWWNRRRRSTRRRSWCFNMTTSTHIKAHSLWESCRTKTWICYTALHTHRNSVLWRIRLLIWRGRWQRSSLQTCRKLLKKWRKSSSATKPRPCKCSLRQSLGIWPIFGRGCRGKNWWLRWLCDRILCFKLLINTFTWWLGDSFWRGRPETKFGEVIKKG